MGLAVAGEMHVASKIVDAGVPADPRLVIPHYVTAETTLLAVTLRYLGLEHALTKGVDIILPSQAVVARRFAHAVVDATLPGDTIKRATAVTIIPGMITGMLMKV